MASPQKRIEQESSVPAGTARLRILTPANCLSFFRILLLPLILYVLSEGNSMFLAAGLLVLAAFTDVLDGYLARKCGDVSRMGMVLDPLADKLMIGSVGAFLVSLADFPLWLIVTVVLRDCAILIGGLLLIRAKGSPVPPNLAGKLTTVLLTITLFLFIINAGPLLRLSFVWLSTLLLAVSSSIYLTAFAKLMRRRGPIGMAAKDN